MLDYSALQMRIIQLQISDQFVVHMYVLSSILKYLFTHALILHELISYPFTFP